MRSEILLVTGRFQIDNSVSIGSGAFSRVHPAIDLETKQEVAVKIMLTRHGARQVQTESKILKQLQGRNFPKLYWHGTHQGLETEVMQRLGRSVLDLFLECRRKFSLATVLQIGEQLLPALQELHSLGYIHMDLKPDNLVMGRGADEDTVFLIDFGLAEMIMPHGKHVKKKKGLKFKGNVFWASPNLLAGIAGSRRDDLEAFIYVLLYMLRGELPWQQVRDHKNRMQRVIEAKTATSLASLCHSLPPSFLKVFEYIRSLSFSEEPNYDWIRQQFLETAKTAAVKFDGSFDWKEPPREFGVINSVQDLAIMDSVGDEHYSENETSEVTYPIPLPIKARSGSIFAFDRAPTLPRHSRVNANPKHLMAALNRQDTGSRSPGSLMLIRQSSFKSSLGDSAGEPSPCMGRSITDAIREQTFTEVSKMAAAEVRRASIKIAVLPPDSSPSEDSDTPKSETVPTFTQVIRDKLSKNM